MYGSRVLPGRPRNSDCSVGDDIWHRERPNRLAQAIMWDDPLELIGEHVGFRECHDARKDSGRGSFYEARPSRQAVWDETIPETRAKGQ